MEWTLHCCGWISAEVQFNKVYECEQLEICTNGIWYPHQNNEMACKSCDKWWCAYYNALFLCWWIRTMTGGCRVHVLWRAFQQRCWKVLMDPMPTVWRLGTRFVYWFRLRRVWMRFLSLNKLIFLIFFTFFWMILGVPNL